MDNIELFDAKGAAAFLAVPLTTISGATAQKLLTPAKKFGRLLYTRRDLEQYGKVGDEQLIAERLQAGEHPVDIYLSLHTRLRIADVLRVTKTWAEMNGMWLIQAPPGSYARWLHRMNLTHIRPHHLRRVIEACLLDAHTVQVARLSVMEQRLEKKTSDVKNDDESQGADENPV